MPVGPVVQRRGLAAWPRRWSVALLLAACGGGGGAHAHNAHGQRRRHHRRAARRSANPRAAARSRVGQLAKQTPTDIFPLVDSASCTTPTLNFIQNQYVPLYAGPERRRAGHRRAHQRRRAAALLARRQDRDDHAQARPAVVGRQAGAGAGRGLLPRPAEGRAQGDLGELVPVLARRVPRERCELHDRRHAHARPAPDARRQPDLVHQRPAAGCRCRDLPAAQPGLERRRSVRRARDRLGHQPGRCAADLQLPARAGPGHRHVRLRARSGRSSTGRSGCRASRAPRLLRPRPQQPLWPHAEGPSRATSRCGPTPARPRCCPR